PKSDTWNAVTPLPRARGALVAATIKGKIYAIGGVVPGSGAVGELTEFDPKTQTWRTLTPMSRKREHLAATALGGKLYVAGGRANGKLFNDLEIYNPTTQKWAKGPNMPTARGGTNAAALEGKLIVFGGEGGRIYPEVEEYDPQKKKWRRLADMLVPLHGIYPVTQGGRVLIAGGGLKPGMGDTNTVLSFRYLPSGVERYGRWSPACRGAIRMYVNGPPTAGQSQFQCSTTATAQNRAVGVLALAAAPDRIGTRFLDLTLHIGLNPAPVTLPAAANANGRAKTPLPLPAGTRGLWCHAQYIWAKSQGCAGTLAGSDALTIVVQ
ncbi:MAG: kelch repeat-containing protein, partial [Planctomycetota bacterium]|nr:kelch repeat-containing protein [Planctomycetota bacterium]